MRLLVASLSDLPWLGLGGGFDYINMCGVLHHLPSPPAVLAALARQLSPSGGLGLMVYGALGRRGVYEVQAMLRLLHSAGNRSADRETPSAADGASPWPAAARIADAYELLASVPSTSTVRLNPTIWGSDDATGKHGDAGVYDMFLHAIDAPYTWPRVLSEARAAGLRALAPLQPALLNPAYWVRPCEGAVASCAHPGVAGEGSDTKSASVGVLRARLGMLERAGRAHFAELLNGTHAPAPALPLTNTRTLTTERAALAPTLTPLPSRWSRPHPEALDLPLAHGRPRRGRWRRGRAVRL